MLHRVFSVTIFLSLKISVNVTIILSEHLSPPCRGSKFAVSLSPCSALPPMCTFQVLSLHPHLAPYLLPLP